MANLPIILLNDPVLRRKSDPIERVDAEVERLIDDMLETMYAAPGIGLAAVQVNVPRRLLVLDIADSEEGEEPKPIVMINPTIVAVGNELKSYEEGCLSIPDIRVEIERPATVTVEFVDRQGRPQTLNADGLLATAVQHEIDHLDGKMIVDFLSKLKRDMVIRKFRKIARGEMA
jgi:peptide deformylase